MLESITKFWQATVKLVTLRELVMLKVKLDPLSQRRIILVEFKSVQFKISVAFWFEIVIDD